MNQFDEVQRRRARRAELIEQVAAGRLSPDNAEALSIAEGVGPLILNPTYEEIDGFIEPRWTLLMAFAWAAWGQNRDHVRLYFPDYRSQCRRWVRSGAGYVLAPLKPYTAYEAIGPILEDWHDDISGLVGQGNQKIRIVWHALRANFRAGRIATYAQLVNDPAKGVELIPAINWQGLFLMKPTGLLIDALCYQDGSPVYFNVTVDKAALLEAYAPMEEGAALPLPSLTPADDPVTEGEADQGDGDETSSALQTRFAKQALLLSFPPNGIVPATPTIKSNMRSVHARFAKLTAESPKVRAPGERKWRDIRAGKYGPINDL